jgi:hypothetical protein
MRACVDMSAQDLRRAGRGPGPELVEVLAGELVDRRASSARGSRPCTCTCLQF